MVGSVVYISLFTAVGIVCIGCVPYANRMWDKNLSIPFNSLLILCATWSFLSAIQIYAPVPFKETIYTLALSVGFVTVFSWLYFVSEYVGLTFHREKKFQIISVFTILVVIGLKLTNFYYGQYFSTTIENTPFVHLSIERSFLYNTTTIIAYAISTYGFLLIFRMFRQSQVRTTGLQMSLIVLFAPGLVEILSHASPEVYVFKLPYEPLGVALFALSVLFVSSDKFNSVGKIGKKQTVDNFGIPTLICSDDGECQYINSSTEDLLESSEITRDELVGIIQDDVSVITIKSSDDCRHYTVKKENVDLGDHTIGVSYILTDVTELVTKDKIIEKHKTQKNNIADTSRHHLRNQASVIQGLISMSEQESNEKTREAVDRITYVAENISEIVDYSSPVETKQLIDIRDIMTELSTELNISYTEQTEIFADEEKVYSLLRHYIKFIEDHGAENVFVSVGEGNLNLVSDAQDVDINVVDAAYEHGEIALDYIALNKITILADSLFWDIKFAMYDENLLITFNGVQDNISGSGED